MKTLATLAALSPLAALTLAALPAQAQTVDPLGVTLTPEGGASILPGGTVVYDATFTNTTGSDFLIDGTSFSAGDPATGGLLTGIYTGPFTVGLGTTTQADAFELLVDPTLPPDTVVGGDVAFEGTPLVGGVPTGPDAEAASSPIQFQAGVPAVPEPAPLALLGLGLLPLGMITRRRMAP